MSVFEASLRLLSPFMPFLTEEIWHAVYDGKPAGEVDCADALSRSRRCRSQTRMRCSRWRCCRDLIVEIRALRKEIGVEEKGSRSDRGAHRAQICEPSSGKTAPSSSAWRA